MSATNDTPLKRFAAFWFVLGAFLLFGIATLFIAPLARTSEVNAADEAGAERRLAIRETVESEQAQYLARVEKGDKLQVPPSEAFSFVGTKLIQSKPKPFKNDAFRDPSLIQAEAEAGAAENSEKEASPETTTPATKVEAPAAKVETPAAKVETRAAKVETPAVKVEAPAAKVETPAAKVETPAAKVETPAPAKKVEEPAVKVEEPAPKKEEPAPEKEEPAPNAPRPETQI